MAMTVEQKKALAMAVARGRLQAGVPPVREEASYREQFGRGMMDVYQGGKQLALGYGAKFGKGGAEERNKAIFDKYNKQLAEELSLYDKYNPGIQPARIAGNIATPLSLLPAAAGTGAARAASVPAMGALFGATQPVSDAENFAKTKAEQAAIGAVVAPVLPLAGKAIGKVGSGIKNMVAPLSKKGRTEAIESLLRNQAGTDTDKIVRALQQPSGDKTTAQMIAAANRVSGDDFGAPLVRLEKDLAREGIAGKSLRSRYAEQAAGRKSVVEGIAGTEARMRDAVARRAAAVDPYYKSVDDSVNIVATDDVSAYIKEVIKRAPNEPGITGPLKWINNRINGKIVDGKLVKDDLTPGAMHSLSKQIKVMANKKNPAGQSLYNKTVLSAVKGRLDEAIGQTEEAFLSAQRIYAKGSVPINRMKVGKELAYALESALESETPASLANAVRNAPRTIQRATKIGAYESLSDILSPRQVQNVENVVAELLNQKQQSLMERSVRPIFSNIKTGMEPRLPRILERSIVIANHALKRLSVDKSDVYHKEIIGMMMEPEKIIQILQRPQDDKTRRIAMEIVNKLSAQVPAQTFGREVEN